MNSLLKNLLLGGSATALAAGAALTNAYAQDNTPVAAPTDDIETINSSVSRIDLKGFEAPTPVTVIGVDTLNRDAKVNIGDEIRELPQIRGGTSIQTGSNVGCVVQVDAGVDTIALRNMGAQRNLVLFDHQRVSPSAIQEGTVDLSLIPSGLVQRVDVVTGGASAAWGSDAVTGVINIVINKTYEGFKGNVTYSNSTEVSNPVYKASFAWGTSFLGGKGHIVAAADITHADADLFAGDVWRSHAPNGRQFVYNPAYCNSIVYAGNATTGGTCASVNAGQPALVYGYGVGNAQTVVGGLVSNNTTGVAGSTLSANSLKGTMFVGQDATPTQFNYGTLYSNSSCYNGCTNNQYGTGGWGPQTNPYHSGTYFLYTSYQILPDVKASVQLNYSRLTARISGNTVSGANRTVYADNPYLPDSIAQQFVCQGGVAYGTPGATCVGQLSNGYDPYTHQNNPVVLSASQISAGTTQLQALQSRPLQTLTTSFEFSGNRPNPSPTSDNAVSNDATDFSWNAKCAALYNNCGWSNKQVMRGVFTLEGALGDDWTWNAYIQNSDVRIKQNVQQVIQQRVNNALDAVRITSGNVGTSGLPIGSIQCRALLNASYAAAVPSNSFGITTAGELAGCVPFDPFGNGVASSAVLDYVSPSKFNDPNVPASTALIRMQQAAGAFSLQGVLPWKLPAGDIGVAFGGEWRLERQGEYDIDPRSQLNMYPSGNMGSNFEGHLHAEEGFLEIDAPILKNDFVQSLDVSLAGRLTNYSFSGLVETWKLGATSQVNDDVKLRVTWSYDIRQPDIWDLYAPGANATQTCAPFVPGNNNGLSNQCYNVNGGNPNLQPEKANTIAAGIVLTPSFLDGVTASVDWYQIHLHGALFTPGLTEPIGRCQQGDLNFCQLLVFANQGNFASANGCGYLPGTTTVNPNRSGCPGADTNSQVIYIHTAPVNAALLTTAGFDFAVAYGFDLFTGSADVSFNGNYMYDFSRTLSSLINGVLTPITFQGAGTTGGYYSGGPKFEGTFNFNYREGAWSFGVQSRITGDSVMNFGNEGNPNIPLQTLTFNKINGQDVAIPSSGQTYQGWTSTNYNPIVALVDLRASYKWSNNVTLFGAIDNVQDIPVITQTGGQRRTYRMGLRFNY